jgi:hypothetical protein
MSQVDWARLKSGIVKTPFKGLLNVRIEQVNGHGVIAYHPKTGQTYKFKLDGTAIGHTSPGYSLHQPSDFTKEEQTKFF